MPRWHLGSQPATHARLSQAHCMLAPLSQSPHMPTRPAGSHTQLGFPSRAVVGSAAPHICTRQKSGAGRRPPAPTAAPKSANMRCRTAGESDAAPCLSAKTGDRT